MKPTVTGIRTVSRAAGTALIRCLLLPVAIAALHGCASPPSTVEAFQQKLVRQLTNAKLAYNNLDVRERTGKTDTDESQDKFWVALDMSGNKNLYSISGLKGMPINVCRLSNTPLSDISPLAGMPLSILAIDGTKVVNLAPLSGMPLKTLFINNSTITDLSALEGLQLEHIRFSPEHISTGIEVLQNMASLKQINRMSVREFWDKHKAGLFR